MLTSFGCIGEQAAHAADQPFLGAHLEATSRHRLKRLDDEERKIK
jgi:hypothetical protein